MYAAGHGIGNLRATRAGGRAELRIGRVVQPPVRAAAVLAAVVAASVGFALVAQGSPPRPEATVVVQPGDTLWSIAEAHYPSEDVRVRVDDIERANGLGDPVIEVGQTLRLPG